MESLIDSLEPSKWVPLEASKKEGFKEYQVMRQHVPMPPNAYRFLLQEEDMDPRHVIVKFTTKDPLKDIGTCELKIDEDNNVLGIDLDGDCVVLKS